MINTKKFFELSTELLSRSLAYTILNNFKNWELNRIITPNMFDIKDKNVKLINLEIKDGYIATFDKEYYEKRDSFFVEYNNYTLHIIDMISKVKAKVIIIKYNNIPIEDLIFPLRTRYRSNYAPDLFPFVVNVYKEYLKLSILDRIEFLIILKIKYDKTYEK